MASNSQAVAILKGTRGGHAPPDFCLAPRLDTTTATAKVIEQPVQIEEAVNNG